jgi:hypothetical protein
VSLADPVGIEAQIAAAIATDERERLPQDEALAGLGARANHVQR